VEDRRVKCGRKDRGKRERTEKRREEGGEEESSRAVVQNVLEREGEGMWSVVKRDRMVSSKGIMWNVLKNRSIRN
jgi:hypothetical protein